MIDREHDSDVVIYVSLEGGFGDTLRSLRAFQVDLNFDTEGRSSLRIVGMIHDLNRVNNISVIA